MAEWGANPVFEIPPKQRHTIMVCVKQRVLNVGRARVKEGVMITHKEVAGYIAGALVVFEAFGIQPPVDWIISTLSGDAKNLFKGADDDNH